MLSRDFTSSTFAKYPDIHREYLQSHQVYKIVFWTIFGVYTAYTGVTFSLYLYYVLRRQDKALKERSVYLTSLQTFFGYVFGINAIFHSAILDYPCYVDVWLIYGAYVPWMTTLALSMARYYTRKRTNIIFVNKTQQTPIDPSELDSYLTRLTALCMESTTDFGEAMYFQQRRPHSIDVSVRASEQSSEQVREVALFPDISPPSEEHTHQSEKKRHSSSSDENQQLSIQDFRFVVWQRRLSSSMFITWVIGASFVVQFVLMVFFTIFSRKMSLSKHYHNCVRGWVFIPITVVSGLFNGLVYPVYIFVVWPFQDGYGIRTSLVVGSALSVGFWAAAITWRLVKHDADIFISGVATSSDAYTNPRIPPQPGDSSSQRTLETTRSSSRRALWAKRVLSNRFYAVAMGLYSLFLVGVLALMTSLYSHLSLKHVHYNCFGGVVFVPLLAFSGIFNLIICPMYTFLIWNYEDAYGIQKTMTFSFVTGIFAWIATLVWRLNPRWANHQISPVVVYMIQFILAHTGFVTIPVIHSIRFRKMQQQGRNDTEIMHASSFLGGASESRFADSHASKQSFLIALKNSHEHHKLEKFAEQCLCAELISFLDVYLAFKLCVYCSIVSGETNQDNCNHHCAGVDNSRSVVVPSIVITEADSTAAIPGQLEANYQAPLQQAEPLNSLSRQTSQQSKRMSRLRKHFSHALLSIRRSSSNSSQTTSITTDVTADEESITYKRAAEDLTSLDTGIVETIEHAFPQYGIAYSTPVPEELREKLVAIVKTFILPGAPWEINVSSRIIEASQEFANGGTMPCGALDDAKNEVIDLLYSNVYIRYQQLRH
ncbi:hypothetical protein LPJ78_003035 [Coemansia sp. RSA 989]|nr:hypothetical protein LPJ78_003035 [Coemansia sp. RSA 989]